MSRFSCQEQQESIRALAGIGTLQKLQLARRTCRRMSGELLLRSVAEEPTCSDEWEEQDVWACTRALLSLLENETQVAGEL